MGASNSIHIEQKDNGIFNIIVDDYPNYPIAYLRLCLNPELNKYCVLEDCDIGGEFSNHRKILVVGIRLPEDGIRKEGIYEQSFYKSTGINSIKYIEKFLNTKLISDKDYEDSLDLWLPFSGLGYSSEKKEDTKFLKNFFDCSTKNELCLYGRFGRFNPNLMQISYCLGGGFWLNNFDKFKDFNLHKLPSLDDKIKSLACFYLPSSINFTDNLMCCRFINDYIGNALVLNYSEQSLSYKAHTFRIFKDKDIRNFKADWRIINILNDEKFLEFSYKGLLATENDRMFSTNFWLNYLTTINSLKTKKHRIYDLILSINNEKYKEPILTESIEPIVLEHSELKFGTIDNPWKKMSDASKGEYYKRGDKICLKKK